MTRRSLPAALLAAMRPKQWIKNVLVFGGLAFTGRWHEATSGAGAGGLLSWPDILLAVTAFAVYCAISSAGYLVNDVCDVEADRAHPEKQHRPIAAGEVSLELAKWVAGLLFIGALVVAWLLSRRGGDTQYFVLTAAAYAVTTVAYSFFLKHLVIIDVLTIGILFVLRAVGGCYVIPEPPSPWIIVCTLFGALFIALCKRRGELTAQIDSGGATRKVLRKYQAADGPPASLLDGWINIAATSTIMTYAMYTFVRPTEIVMQQAAQPTGLAVPVGEQTGLMFSIPFVVYGVLRYMYLVTKKDIGQSPERLLTDRGMLINLALWALVVLLATSGRQI